MTGSRIWDIFMGLAALASIAGGVACLVAAPTLQVVLVAITMFGVFGVIIASVMSRRAPTRIGRDALIRTGNKLIREAKREVVMFGGDMSWAGDYEEAIRATRDSGKRVRIIYPNSTAKKVVRNIEILRAAGAHLISTPTDSGLRAMLVDPDDQRDAMFFVASRTLHTDGVPVGPGDQGSETNYKYIAKVYGMRNDWVLIHVGRKVCELLCSSPNSGTNT
jgi:hypothetical protein